jgi:hypothetical protein
MFKYVPNMVIRRDLQTPSVKEQTPLTALNTVLASAHTQTTLRDSLGATRQQAIAKTPAK